MFLLTKEEFQKEKFKKMENVDLIEVSNKTDRVFEKLFKSPKCQKQDLY